MITKLGEPPVTFKANPSGGIVSTTRLDGVDVTAPPVKATKVPSTRMPISNVVGSVPVNIKPFLADVNANSDIDLASLTPVVVIFDIFYSFHLVVKNDCEFITSDDPSLRGYTMSSSIEPLIVSVPAVLANMVPNW